MPARERAGRGVLARAADVGAAAQAIVGHRLAGHRRARDDRDPRSRRTARCARCWRHAAGRSPRLGQCVRARSARRRVEHVAHSLDGRIAADPRRRPDAAGHRIDHRARSLRHDASCATVRSPARGAAAVDGKHRLDASTGAGRRKDRGAGPALIHYAPRKPLRIDATHAPARANGMIGFGDIRRRRQSVGERRPDRAADATVRLAAQAPTPGQAAIAVALIPADGIGEAINDRLRRAAHRATRRSRSPPSTVRRSSCAASAVWAGSPPGNTGSLAFAFPIFLVIILGRIPFGHVGSIVVTIGVGPVGRVALDRRFGLGAPASASGKIAERYCVPTSLPWRLSVVGSCVAKKMSSRSP